jgi:hypothetical protein
MLQVEGQDELESADHRFQITHAKIGILGLGIAEILPFPPVEREQSVCVDHQVSILASVGVVWRRESIAGCRSNVW